MEYISGCRQALLSPAFHSEGNDIVIGAVDPEGNPLYGSPALLLDVVAARISDGVNDPMISHDANMRPEKQIPDQPDVGGIGYQEEITWLQ